MTRSVVVGERPHAAWAGNLEHQCETPAFRRFASQVLGVSWEDYLRLFWRTNVFPFRSHVPWSDVAAKVGADMIRRLAERNPIVACGRRAAKAFGLPEDAPFLSAWYRAGDGWVKCHPAVGDLFLFPHPSGRCREWNSRTFRKKAAAFGRKVMERVTR